MWLPHPLSFYVGVGAQTQVLIFVRKALYSLSRIPSPPLANLTSPTHGRPAFLISLSYVIFVLSFFNVPLPQRGWRLKLKVTKTILLTFLVFPSYWFSFLSPKKSLHPLPPLPCLWGTSSQPGSAACLSIPVASLHSSPIAYGMWIAWHSLDKILLDLYLPPIAGVHHPLPHSSHALLPSASILSSFCPVLD